ncbi:50S ribosomal protein L3 [Candidatus Gugararchaeum adminiculabundum]|nr:50S ribosomal protein L3 [Candidatus Gugararchaeum adminiculabundum]
MAMKNRHRHGSLAFRPRVRAWKQVPRVNSWAPSEHTGLLGFAGYKAGMTHIQMTEDEESPAKGQEVSVPVTILEAPAITIYGVRAYKGTYDKCVSFDIISDDEKILKAIGVNTSKKKKVEPPSDVDKKLASVRSIFVLCYVSSSATGIGKKINEKMEIAVGGKSVKEQFEFAKTLLGKTVKASEVFKPGEYVDAIGVTKGKGWQGAVKRFGVAQQRPKATSKRRHVGTLGPWTPSYVMYTTPMAGQMGYHSRTELNKRILKIGAGTEVNPKGGFLQYGIVKNDYIMVKGSVAGPRKRLIRLRKSVRKIGDVKAPDVSYISVESKQQ